MKKFNVIIKDTQRGQHRAIAEAGVLNTTKAGLEARPVTILTVDGETITDVRIRDLTVFENVSSHPEKHKPIAPPVEPDFVVGPDGQTLHQILEVEVAPRYYDASKDLEILPAHYEKFTVNIDGKTCPDCMSKSTKPGYIIAAYAEGEPNVVCQCVICRRYLWLVLVKPKGEDTLRPFIQTMEEDK
jgi:hypothetical protein